jgi:hypothetical protein
MLAVTSTLSVRARVLGRPEPPFDRLFDPLAAAWLAGGPLAERLGPPWSDENALLARTRKRARLPDPLAAALRDYHVRLGASPQSLAALDRLAAGESTCTIAGQQPARWAAAVRPAQGGRSRRSGAPRSAAHPDPVRTGVLEPRRGL